MNNFPISVEQIALGMTNASSAMAAAGNTFEETVALLTAANTTVQNALKSSTALRTISARLRKTKTELDDLGEAMTESTYDGLVSALTSHHVALTDINGEFRSTYDIMKDIAAQWDDMTNMEQAALAEAIAGTRQQTVFYSIVENFREATGAMEEMGNSAGALSNSYSVYMDTIAAHTQDFTTAWQTFSMNFVNSGTVKFFVDLGTTLLNVADKLQRVHMLLPSILGIINAFKAMKLLKSMSDVRKSIKNLGDTIQSGAAITSAMRKQVEGLTDDQKREIVALVEARAAQTGENAEVLKASLGLEGYTAATVDATAANKGFAASIKDIFASNPLGWITTAASLIIGGISLLTNETEDVAENIISVSEAINNIKDAGNTFRQTKSSAEDLIPKFVTLSKGVDEYGKNLSLTEEGYKDYIDISNQLADLFPDISAGLDKNGNAMLNLKGNAEELTKALNDQVEAARKLANTKIASNLDDVVKALRYGDSENIKGWDDYDPLNKASGLGIIGNGQLFENLEKKYYNKSGYSFTAAGTYNNLSEDEQEQIRKIQDQRKVISEREKLVADIKELLKKGKDISELGMSKDELDAIFGTDFGGLSFLYGAYQNDRISGSQLDSFLNAPVQAEKNKLYSMGEYQNYLNPIRQALSGWVQIKPEFESMATDIQDITLKMVGAISAEDLDGKSSQEMQKFIDEYIIAPLQDKAPEVQDAFSALSNATTAFKSGTIGATEFKNAIQSAQNVLASHGYQKSLDLMNESLDFTATVKQIDDLKRALLSAGNDADRVAKYLSSLSGDDFTIAYEIISKNPNMSIDDLITAIERAKFSAAEMKDVSLDLTDMFSDLDKITKGLDKITSAMEDLKKGTALTKAEMIKLAQQFPELLKQSNLFTDGSIKGQEKLLRVVMESAKKEQDAIIEAKINELTATLGAVKKQITIEQAKQELLLHIQTMYASGRVKSEKDLVNEIHDLNILEATNFVEMKNGELKVNSNMLNQTSNATQSSLNSLIRLAWQGYSDSVVDAFNAMANAGIQSTVNYASVAGGLLIELGMDAAYAQWDSLPQAGRDVVIREAQNRYNALYSQLNSAGYRNVGKTTLSGVSGAGNVSYTDLSSVLGALSASSNTMSELKKFEQDILAEISNLEKIKNMSLDEFIASMESGSKSSSKSSSSSSSKSGVDDEFKTLYDTYKFKVNMGEMTEAEFLKKLKELLDTYNDGSSAYYKYFEELKKGIESLSDDAKKAIDNFVQYRMKVIKDQKQQEKNALKDRLNQLKSFYDKQKQMLQDERDEEKYLDEQSEKRKKVSDIQAQLARLSHDNSAWAAKRTLELTADLAEATKELADFEKDHAVDEQLDFLDKEYERVAAEIESSISNIENYLNDPTSLYYQALAEIKTGTNDIFAEMQEYARLNGNGITNEANDLLTKLVDALNAYNAYYGGGKVSGYSGAASGIGRLTGYASGTRYASAGLHRVFEHGYEGIFQSSDGQTYKMFGGGERVLNAKATDFLYNFAEAGAKQFGGSSLSKISSVVNAATGSPIISLGDIVIQGNASDRSISEIRQAQKDQVRMILTEFNKLRH